MTHYDVLIVGAGHAGAQAASMLRQLGFAGSVAMITDEAHPPYERPPLSKEYFAGEKPFEAIMIRPAEFWAAKAIDLILNERVTEVDATAHRITTAHGRIFGYSHLVWAAGGAPRILSCPGHDLTGVFTVRTRADVDKMQRHLGGTHRVVIIGGGYIGLEAAAVLVKFGKHVTIVEMASRVLARVAGAPISEFYQAEHRAHGVTILLDAELTALEGHDGQVTGVRLTDGTLLPADMVVVGIGIIPAVQPLLAAGAAGGNGVDVDELCRTSLPDIYAVGDCAAHVNRFAEGSRIRLESVQNANDQANVFAKAITGAAQAYDALPWFWSMQYDLRLQTIGLSTGHDAVVVRGDVGSRSFSVVYLRRGAVIALDCVNATRDFVQGKKLVSEGRVIDPALLADASVPFKTLLG